MTHVDVSDFTRASKKLRAARSKLRRFIGRRLNEAAKPVMLKVLARGSEAMPQRGGLARHLASKGNARLSTTASSFTAILGRRGAYVAGPNSGLARHPTWGHRDRWVSQSVPAGTYDAAFEDAAGEGGEAVAKALDDLARDL